MAFPPVPCPLLLAPLLPLHFQSAIVPLLRSTHHSCHWPFMHVALSERPLPGISPRVGVASGFTLSALRALAQWLEYRKQQQGPSMCELIRMRALDLTVSSCGMPESQSHFPRPTLEGKAWGLGYCAEQTSGPASPHSGSGWPKQAWQEAHRLPQRTRTCPGGTRGSSPSHTAQPQSCLVHTVCPLGQASRSSLAPSQADLVSSSPFIAFHTCCIALQVEVKTFSNRAITPLLM